MFLTCSSPALKSRILLAPKAGADDIRVHPARRARSKNATAHMPLVRCGWHASMAAITLFTVRPWKACLRDQPFRLHAGPVDAALAGEALADMEPLIACLGSWEDAITPVFARASASSLSHLATTVPAILSGFTSATWSPSFSKARRTSPRRLASTASFRAGSHWRMISSMTAVAMLAAWSWAKGLPASPPARPARRPRGHYHPRPSPPGPPRPPPGPPSGYARSASSA